MPSATYSFVHGSLVLLALSGFCGGGSTARNLVQADGMSIVGLPLTGAFVACDLCCASKSLYKF